jgi:dihydroorotase/allantoinase
MSADLVIKNGILVSAEAEMPGVGVAARDGRILAIAADEDLPPAERVLDADGRHILPGVIDGHVHLREPGLEYKEDFGTGTLAAVMGGVTCVLDMPNTKPSTSTPEFVNLKRRLAEEKALADFGIIGLVVQENVDQLLPMRDAGVVGYKCFLGETIGNIPAPDDGLLVEAMSIIASTGLRIGFHAENNDVMQHLIRKYKAEGRTDARAHLETRPVLAEVESIQRLALFGQHTGCKVHVYHLSSKDGMETIAEWRDKGVNITCETGAHYCFLSLEEYERQGSVVRMNPPIRGLQHGEGLLQGLLDGRVSMIATDHSPHTREEKINDDIWKAISGFVGVETSVQVFLDRAVNAGKMTLPEFVRVTSRNPAQVWSMAPRKGSLRVGSDADFTLVDLNKEWVIDASKLHSKNTVSPFDGWRGKGMAVATIVRGQIVMQDGQLVGQASGRMVHPTGYAAPAAVA